MACNHIRDPVKVGDYTVLVSGYHENTCAPPVPDFGIYLSTAWEKLQTPYQAVVIDWPDFGVLEMRNLQKLVRFAQNKIDAGGILEVACFGGHGRTGTFVACLIARYEKLEGDEAIVALRQRFCPQGIETEEQEELVRRFAREPIPP
jgi:protein-tyrosine phosphatase